jgi:hypothetical protein
MVLLAFGSVKAHLFSYPGHPWDLAHSPPPRVGVEMKALSPLLSLFAKWACAQYRFTARHVNSLSYPGSKKQNRSLHTSAQDVQITRMATI